jgi:DNA-directed RNA polymerase subunit RPC12/RpoP
MPIQIVCSNCGFTLAYFSRVRDITTTKKVASWYHYKCPKCGNKLNPENLKTISITTKYIHSPSRMWRKK